MVTFATDEGFFDFVPANGGATTQAHARSVSIALRGHFPVLPSRQYDLTEARRKLMDIVRGANQRLPSILPLVSVLHSRFAFDRQPRALDFNFICRSLDRMIRPGADKHTTPSPAADRLAVYFALAYHSLKFVRTARSPFVVVSSQTVDAIIKVMYALTRAELEHGVSELLQGSKIRTGESVAGKLETFLQHWILWNDPRLVRAVEAVLEEFVGHSRTLDSPRALSSVLNELKSWDLFPWKDEGEHQTESTDHVIGNEEPSPVKTMHIPDIQGGHGSTPLPDVSVPLPKAPPKAKTQHSHLFTTNLVQGSIFLNRSIAASFDPEYNLLSIYIPRIPSIPSILSPHSKVNASARSISLKKQYFPLIPRENAEKYQFRLGVESSAIRLQVQLHSKTFEWDENTVTVSLTETVPIELKSMSQSRGLDLALSRVEPVISDHELQLPQPTDSTTEPPDLSESDPSVAVDEPSDLPLSLISLHAQASAGRIAGLYMRRQQIEAPFLVTEHGHEKISSVAGWHERIGTDAYIPISRPFDSGLALLAQKKLLGERVPTLVYGGHKRRSLESKLEEAFLPGLKLASILEERDLYHRRLRDLQSELRTLPTFHIFRCILLESGSPQQRSEGQLVKAFCLDLDLNVDILLPAHSDQFFKGDQVICTEILELDPLSGLFVVSL